MIDTREQEHFDEVRQSINGDAIVAAYDIENRKDTILSQKKYMRDSHGDMDDHEFLQNMTNVNNDTQFVAHEQRRLDRLTRQLEKPYFGKLSFTYDDGETLTAYIGNQGYIRSGSDDQAVYDWRAPVSAMYYGGGCGEASYTAEGQTHHGTITEKKQFDVAKGQLRNVVDVEEQLNDSLLMGALQENSSAKLRSVVATIQREQNDIIRNTTAYNLVVDGPAGSGKTVIAMHRLAWLLYNNRKTLKTDNVLMLSPNGIFGDYISGVLPETGEENVPEKEFDSLMEEILFLDESYETKLDQSDFILTANESDDARLRAIGVKSSLAFYNKLNEYLESYVGGIKLKDFHFQKVTYTSSELENAFVRRFAAYPVYERFEKIAYFVADRVEDLQGTNLDDSKRAKLEVQITKSLVQVYAEGNLVRIYMDFLATLDDPNLACTTNEYGQVRYEDVLVLFYIQLYFYGCKSYQNIKQLVMDEMQDYNVFQLAAVDRIFPCKKTILGDRHQVLMMEDDVVDVIDAIYDKVEHFELATCYRSTAEINAFCSAILGKESAGKSYARHGKEPEVVDAYGLEGAAEFIEDMLSYGEMDAYENVAILCDDEAVAYKLHSLLEESCDVTYLTHQSTVYSGGTVVMPKFLAKGMEFDAVYVVNGSDPCANEVARHGYYISCTRALHELYVINYIDEMEI